jgi:hypothetical protein
MQARSREVACTVIALAVLWAAPAPASDSTGHPEVVESSANEGRARLRIERSFARGLYRDAGSMTTVLIPPALLRFGSIDAQALKFTSRGLMSASVHGPVAHLDPHETAVPNPWSGVKWQVVEGEGLRPSVAVHVYGDIDSESPAAFSGEGVRPSIRTTLDWQLTHDFSLAAMPGVVYDKTDGQRHASGVLGVALGKAWTPRFQTYVEAAAERIASTRHGGSTVVYNLGGAYLLRDTVQIDSALSWAAGSDTAPLTWSVGLWMQF